MCLISLAVKTHPKYKLVLLANRDEYHQRPTKKADWWYENGNIFGGKDLSGGGSWLAISKNGKISAITNYRDTSRKVENNISRGLILSNYLENNINALDYFEKLSASKDNYEGYNLIFGNQNKLYHYSNISNKLTALDNGVHTISNHLLDTPWPKVLKANEVMQNLVENNNDFPIETAFQLFKNKDKAPDNKLPNTGIGIEYERMLSSIYIDVPGYGTRATSIITIDNNNKVYFEEREFVLKTQSSTSFFIES